MINVFMIAGWECRDCDIAFPNPSFVRMSLKERHDRSARVRRCRHWSGL